MSQPAIYFLSPFILSVPMLGDGSSQGGLQMREEMKGEDENMREKDREGTMKLDMASVLD